MEEHKCRDLLEEDYVGEIDGFPLYGYAVHAIVKTKKGWILHNNEYANYISFCPFCGKKLE